VALGGFEVLTVQFSGRASLVAYADGGANSSIALGGPFRLRTADAIEHRLSGEDSWERLVPLLGLRHDHISRVSVSHAASLRVEFSSGALLEVDPDAQYENWELTGPGNLNLVAPPGGGDPRIRS
jgi:hypothetical protein